MTSATLRAKLRSGRTLWKGTIWDGLSARLAAEAGFDVLMASGYNISASMALPDVGLTSMAEVLNSARICARAAGNTPVLADIDTGYGNAVNVMRTVHEFENAGVAGVQLEDQVSPKKCPYLGDTPLIPLEEAVGKLRAAADARRNPELLISARTDAHSIDEAIARGRAYVQAGADMVFVVSKYVVKNLDDARRIKEAIGAPLAFSAFGWHDEKFSTADIENMGGCIIGFPFAAITSAAEAVKRNYGALIKSKDVRSLPQPTMDIKEFERLIGMAEVARIEREYLPKA
jgi:2-methylisocitrate lyase-like PEP mutase family enzyme